MAMFGGRPVDICEHPAKLGIGLGIDFHKCGNSLYKVSHGSATIYSLEQKTAHQNINECEHSFITSTVESERRQEEGKPPGQTSEDSQPLTPLALWVERSHGNVHPDAVRVSKDLDGGILYVGRAYIMGCLLPGKVAERHRVCYVALEGKEYALSRYEILLLQRARAKWVACKDGHIPKNAIPTGFTVQGNVIYSARARCDGTLTPGHLIAGENICRISYDLKEFTFTEYEILTIDTSFGDTESLASSSAREDLEESVSPTQSEYSDSDDFYN